MFESVIIQVGYLEATTTCRFALSDGSKDLFAENAIPEVVHLRNEILTVSPVAGLCFIGRQMIGQYVRGQIILLPEHQLLNLILNVVYLRTLTLKGLRKRIAIYVEDARAEDAG